jgi:enoyl-CoA hydratase/carnithine racemase
MQLSVDQVVQLERPRDGVAVLRIHRPESKNALNMATRQRLAELFVELGQDSTTRAVVLTGGAECFIAGADIREFAAAGAIEMYLRHTELLWEAIAGFPKPVIAAVNGFALGGGCELAMHCDIIVAGESACFGQPEVKLGLMPGAGGTQRLVRAVGKFQAMRIALTGCLVKAPEALAIGLISELVSDEQTITRATELATQIASLPPLAVAQIKEVMLAGADLPLQGALALERKAFQLLFASKDQKEGATAFIEKRKPVYTGE